MPLVDTSYIDEMRELMPPEEQRDAIAALCIDIGDVPERLASHCRRNEAAAVHRISHSAAGSAGMFGGVALADILRRIEAFAAEEDLAQVEALLPEAEALTRRTINAWQASIT